MPLNDSQNKMVLSSLENYSTKVETIKATFSNTITALNSFWVSDETKAMNRNAEYIISLLNQVTTSVESINRDIDSKIQTD